MKHLRRFKNSKLNKRIFAMITAIAMLSVSLPLIDMFDGARSLFGAITSFAEGRNVDRYPIENNVCTINSYTELVNYSKAYNAYPSEYCNVDVTIIITNANDPVVLSEFLSIGTSE